ncbi:MAG: single-stranded-DNA-specific exonuclease RecJ [Flavobacteriales bacterium]
MNFNWKKKPLPDPNISQSLQKELGVSPIIADLLVQRGISNFQLAKQFFRPDLQQLHDPFVMQDMDKAIARVELAIEQGHKILVYGDYDVDGTTSVAMMYIFLQQFSTKVSYYIPDRYKEGYGVSFQGIDYAHENNFSLIISLDCGIKAIDKIEYAKKKGIDFIICDHHRPGKKIPKAVAVLDPKRIDCDYPYKELSGCGVGFKLIQAYCIKNEIPFDKIYHLLDLLVVSIAADIVPITGENRILAYYGLQQINDNARPGLKALIEQSNRKKDELLINDIVFGIAPRINAAGRIDHANKAVELLVETDFQQAKKLSQTIETNNLTRKELDQFITTEALSQVKPEKKSTVVFNENWHKGVIGIVASRIIENFYKPTIVLTESNGFLVGSARSVVGFDIYEAIDQCSHLLDRFGGHKYAAGLSLKKENLNEFVQLFEKVVKERISSEQLTPEIVIDRELAFNQIDLKTYRIIKQMEPFGPGNNRPTFVTTNVFDSGFGKLIGKENNHLKLHLKNEKSNNSIDAIGFGMFDKKDLIEDEKCFDVCYNLDLNQWNGNANLQLRLKDMKECL